MYVFAGCNGAGKSTLIEHFGGDYEFIINPDQMAKQINPIDPRSVDLSAGKEAVKLIRNCLEKEKTFAMETTLSGQYVIRQMNAAKKAGYKVFLYYIGLQDVQMHVDRIRTRVREGGHFIATEDIIRRYDHSLANLQGAIKVADVAIVIDNSGEKYELLLEIHNGEIKKQSKILPTWLKVLEI
ncbi:MAG TPA: zeta toxin family protein [Paenibacillus sp.]|uniref:zeta toxin family protein n=1 Tax=Paenibacillus sp. TaxID=58172 RepID=UPI002BD54E89|nr:zeta toxin family protein [Paenibacillus sp.]HUC94264.1 zeta toxin family protein [Paenibacillus sp.]